VRRLVVMDTEPDERYVDTDLLADLSVKRVIGEAMKRLATDGTIRDGLGQAFEKGFDVPDQFVRDFNKLTYTAYKKSFDKSADYVDKGHLARDLRAVRVPRLVIFGKDDRLVKPAAAEQYRRDFGVPVTLVAGAGHSPMVEQPAETARLLFTSDRQR
jgi:pimeloyl-ACP methyl ester carboxylesterase